MKGYPGAEFKGFATEEEARAYLGPAVETTFDRKPSGEAGSQAKGPRAGEGLAAYVDGSFDQTVGRYAFGCILLVPDGREIRISGSGDNPESLAIRNVAGEMLERLYKNWFLGQLGGNWQTVCSEELAKYGRILEVPQQADFYRNRIDNADSRVFVVISDALRYEVAASLAEQLRRETQADVKLQDVQGIFPTITKFGMAALLPHKELEVEVHGEVLKVMADGVSTDAGYRDRILKAEKPNSVAVKYEDLVNAKRLTEAQW